jgi:hypothetical protein
MMPLCVGAHILLEQFARVTDGGKQNDAWNDAKETERRLHRLNLRNYHNVCHVFSFFGWRFACVSITTGYV